MRLEGDWVKQLEQLSCAPQCLQEVELTQITRSASSIAFNPALLSILKTLNSAESQALWQWVALALPILAVRRRDRYRLLTGQRTLDVYLQLFPQAKTVPIRILEGHRKGLFAQIEALQSLGLILSSTALRWADERQAAHWLTEQLAESPLAEADGTLSDRRLAQLLGVTMPTLQNWRRSE